MRPRLLGEPVRERIPVDDGEPLRRREGALVGRLDRLAEALGSLEVHLRNGCVERVLSAVGARRGPVNDERSVLWLLQARRSR